MKTLYFECNMGAAGDMLMAALLELLPQKEAFLNRMNGLISGVTVAAEPSEKCGILGTHVHVSVHGEEEGEHDHEHHHDHSGMGEIARLISGLDVPEKVRADALAVYGLIAKAESEVHGRPVEQVHFHEVGALDAVADIVGVCLLMHELKPERVAASPVHVGSGQVRCAHGLLPVPAPATALLLKGIPVYGGAVRGELCTPTGAALLRHFVAAFGEMPAMRVEKVGYGMGKKDFEAANCVRAMLGETEENGDTALELCCNLDDMTPEAVGFAMERLLAFGALDVYTVPVGMKKSRPGVMLCCLCHAEKREEMVKLLFRHTTTLGVRVCAYERHTLSRAERVAETGLGPVRVKEASGYGVRREKPEYEDLAKIAREKGISLAEAAEMVR
ncbi:MAG: nickel pincer cofactor biosynthesis protein LarC [Eubacteriales bacterium]|nr:nickel pincer cofactor biosynthesis protein LarC [Eubacteriales bacterium]